MIDYSLSLSDLLLIDGVKEAVQSNDSATLTQHLFINGMDISLPVTTRECRHVNLRGKPVLGVRFEGAERLDKEWIKSGAASLDAIIASTNDKTMFKDLGAMSYQPNQDQAWSSKG